MTFTPLDETPSTPPLRRKLTFGISIAIITLVALVATVILIAPQFRPPATLPPPAAAGTVYPITPRPRPQANGVAAGDPNAKARIDVYEDFQCPACREYTMEIEGQIMRNDVATGRVYYVFHNFPIIDRATWDSAAKESHQAANASMCAADQNRFWDYHDILFNNWTGENVGDFTDPRLVAYAQSLKLDMTRFNKCFQTNPFKAQIEADIAGGQSLGVSGTPSVFVNGQQVTPGYVPSYNWILKAVDQALAK